jgi:hypothetical protein
MNHKESAVQPTLSIAENGGEGELVGLVASNSAWFFAEEMLKSNARRVCAAWNACAGITTEALECQTKKELTKKLIDTNKKLLAALNVCKVALGDILGAAENNDPYRPDELQKAFIADYNLAHETLEKAKEVFNGS